MSLDTKLETYFEQFNQGHALAKQSLLNKLSECSFDSQSTGSRSSSARFVRVALAAAAVLILGFGLVYFNISDNSPVNPSVAWAEAVENTSHVHSIHFKASTGGSELEMWWRQPGDSKAGYKGDYRMEVSNGMVSVCNEDQHASFDPKKNRLTLKAPMPGLELIMLGDLGQMFGPNRSLSQNMLKNSVMISEETITFKGEQCLVRRYQNDERDQLHKCVIGLNPPLIYETVTYRKSDPTKPIWHVEVLEVDKTYPDDLFSIIPKDGTVVRDNRVLKITK